MDDLKNKCLSEMREDGFTLLKNVVPNGECHRLISLIECAYEKYSPDYASNQKKAHSLNDNKTERLVYNLYNKDPAFLGLLDASPYFEIITSILNEGAYDPNEPITLRQMTARCPSPGEPAQNLHIDSRHLGGKFPLMVVAIIALDRFTNENGATRLVPGSHLSDKFPEEKNKERVITKTMEPGDVLLFNGSLWHGGGACNDSTRRWGVLLTYTRWFYKPAFRHEENIDKNLERKLSRQQKVLLGLNSIPPRDEFDRLEAIKPIA